MREVYRHSTDYTEFVRESNRIEGILRDPTKEEVEALEKFVQIEILRISDLQNFVNINQPGARLRDTYGLDVRVGNHYPPKGGPEIREQLEFLLKDINRHWEYRMRYGGDAADFKGRAWRAHIDYETLHPFTDGNGRSGRALWLWCMGGYAPLNFLHTFYYQTLQNVRV